MTGTVPVSTVIPCFRCVRTLERAVASVAVQTALPQEVILVDDGSDDETRALMVQLRARYTPGWIQLVLLDDNVGAASARNAGWEQARGDYVAFLDADDAWHPRKVELQYKFMACDIEVAVSGHGHIQLSELQDAVKIDDADFKNISPIYIVIKNPFVTPSFMVRRNLEYRFLDGRRHMEDHYFLMQVSLAGLRIAKTPMPLAYIFKPIFGDSGLSADLLKMQRSEIENYRLAGKSGNFPRWVVTLLMVYSQLKYVRRLIVVWTRNKYNVL